MSTNHPGNLATEEPTERQRAIRSVEYQQERVQLARAALRDAELDLERAYVVLSEVTSR